MHSCHFNEMTRQQKDSKNRPKFQLWHYKIDPSFELLQTCVVPIFGKFNLHLCVKVISVCLLVWVHSRHLNEMTRQHKVAKIRLNFQLWRYQMDPLFFSWTKKSGIKFWQIHGVKSVWNYSAMSLCLAAQPSIKEGETSFRKFNYFTKLSTSEQQSTLKKAS